MHISSCNARFAQRLCKKENRPVWGGFKKKPIHLICINLVVGKIFCGLWLLLI